MRDSATTPFRISGTVSVFSYLARIRSIQSIDADCSAKVPMRPLLATGGGVEYPPGARGEAIGIQQQMMRLALEEARNALHLGEVPIGAVIAQEQEVIAVGFNQ